RVLVEGENPALTPDGEEVLYSVTGTGTVLAIPRRGGASRSVTMVPGLVRFLGVGADKRVHMMVARSQAWEAWGAPLAGGTAVQDLPTPWSFLYAAPSGGWRAAIEWLPGNYHRVRFVPPGGPLEDPSLHEILSRGAFAWGSDGLTWFYRGEGG